MGKDTEGTVLKVIVMRDGGCLENEFVWVFEVHVGRNLRKRRLGRLYEGTDAKIGSNMEEAWQGEL